MGGYELRWVRSAPGSEGGHSGLSYSVLDGAESGGCRLALVRLVSPGGVRHPVWTPRALLWPWCTPGFFSGLPGFPGFAGCCFWRVPGSCDGEAAAWLGPRVGEWFRRFTGVLAPALASCLRPAGVLLPGLEDLVGRGSAVLDVAGGYG